MNLTHASLTLLTCFTIIASGCSGERPSTFQKEKVVEEKVVVNETDLFTAIIDEDVSKVEQLLENKADVNARDDLGNTPLMVAVPYGNLEIIKLLLERGADVNLSDDLGVTPLLLAEENGQTEIVDLLKQYQK